MDLKPDFTVLTGDYVHRSPRAIELGVGIMEEVRARHGVAAVLGNHDAYVGKLAPTLTDAYAAYYFFTAPQNGPGEGPWSTVIPKSDEGAKFRRLAGETYPSLDFYSFDYGPAHVVG